MSGDNYRWARTALQLAGFEKDSDGNYVTALTDVDRARRALTTLGETARACQTKVTATDRRYIGDFARDLSEHLPGQWSVRVENYSLQVWQGDLAACLWDAGPLLHTLEKYRVPVAAILRSENGIELAVVQTPRHDQYHIGAIFPKDIYLDEAVTPPSSITVQPAAVPAARKVSSTLLADYHRAFFQMQLNHLGDDLAWAHEAYEPGTVLDPPQRDLADAFARFAAVAPHIIAALRTSDAHPFNTHEKAFLEHMDAAFGQTGSASEDPGAARKIPIVDPLALWLTEGDGLIELARTAGRTAPAQTALSLVRAAEPRAVPSPPVQVAASANRR